MFLKKKLNFFFKKILLKHKNKHEFRFLFYFFLCLKLIFFIFLNYFDALISKIIFKKKNYFNIFFKNNTLKNQSRNKMMNCCREKTI
jgi:hypothetical protein